MRLNKKAKAMFFGMAIVLGQNCIRAQSTEHPKLTDHSIYLDGTAAFYSQFSISYERLLYTGEKLSWYGRIGAGGSAMVWGPSGHGGLGGITMLTGKQNRHFELNVDGFALTNGSSYSLHPVFNAGYRYQKPEGGLIYKANLGIVGFGFGLGWSF